MPVTARSPSIMQQLLPVLDWFPAYRRERLLPDVLGGLALWAVMVPGGMVYSAIGVPPIVGLYSIVPLALGVVAAQGRAEFNSLTSTRT
jgi:MFS superfamily sulfate permease-like transporter